VISATLNFLSPDYISAALGQRLLGLVLGLLVVVYANSVPKALAPLLQIRCDPAAEQAMRPIHRHRLVLGGVAYAVTWLIAPLESAAVLSPACWAPPCCWSWPASAGAC